MAALTADTPATGVNGGSTGPIQLAWAVFLYHYLDYHREVGSDAGAHRLGSLEQMIAARLEAALGLGCFRALQNLLDGVLRFDSFHDAQVLFDLSIFDGRAMYEWTFFPDVCCLRDCQGNAASHHFETLASSCFSRAATRTSKLRSVSSASWTGLLSCAKGSARCSAP